eukprot:TRINITY_DN15967_c0_g1_i1.p1 TRINITY_DN15967_c0_g1~~TRINITY_DN15967_c0_g1_i1.p1  ORF type:complete len:272 (-),score=33.93 TRINITY_DN15967_c0_g1_i1:363-1178(-)
MDANSIHWLVGLAILILWQIFGVVGLNKHFSWSDLRHVEHESSHKAHIIKDSTLKYVRFFFAAFSTFTLIVNFWNRNNGFAIFTWYTIWNFLTVVLYFWVSFILSVKKKDMEDGKVTFLHSWQLVWFHVCSTLVLLVDMTVLFVLLPYGIKHHSPHLWTFANGIEHCGNMFMFGFELLFNRLKMRKSLVYFVIIWAGLYSWYALAYHEASGIWRYFFLNIADELAPLWYNGVLLFHVVFYFIVRAICDWKFKKVEARAVPSEISLLIDSEQ